MNKWTWHSFPVISCSEIWYLGSNQSSSDISSVINFHLKNPITLYILFANSLPYFQNRFWLDRLLKSFSPLLFSKLQSKKKINEDLFLNAVVSIFLCASVKKKKKSIEIRTENSGNDWVIASRSNCIKIESFVHSVKWCTWIFIICFILFLIRGFRFFRHIFIRSRFINVRCISRNLGSVLWERQFNLNHYIRSIYKKLTKLN